ncbi:MAG: TonB-dependent receptor plug domain-containing protein, partial [Campylobacteraceae bacterium]|nr:TonB-dependent receptor plug domain-containing protein [Campylobacteraceae bacterium]
IDSDYIKNAPSATNTITDLLRSKSYIQYDQTSRSSATGGEIAPPKISINGAKHYENSFLINGVSNNNNINPSGLPLNYATAQSGQPTGEAQSLFLDTNLIDTVEVYTENIGAEYGGFLGGVINAKIKDASTDRWHIYANYRYTSDSWTKFHWTQTEENALNTTSSAQLQPKFTKHEYTISADGPITDNLGLVLSYGKEESKIPLWSTYMVNGVYEKRETFRENENFLVKLNTNGLDDFKASLTGIYAPYEHTLFQPLYRDSDFTMIGGGYTLIYYMENDFALGKLKNTINYQKNEASRDSDMDFVNQWDNTIPSNGYLNWGMGQNSYEGAFGDYTQDKQSIGYKSIFEFDEIQNGILEHKLKAGIEAEYNKIEAVRGKYTIFYAGNADPTVTGSKDNGILEGSQYSIRTVSGMQQKRDMSYNAAALFAEDNITIDRFYLIPGLRISKDSIADNIDIAWRFFANADVFDDDMLNIYGGYNRYYGAQILSYATYLPIKVYDSHRDNATTPWVHDPVRSDNPQHNLGDLETPYSDELNIGASLKLYDTLFEAKLVNKEGKKEIRSVRAKGNMDTYKEFQNSGESSYWGLTFLISKKYNLGMAGEHESELSATKSKSKTNGFDPVSDYDYDDLGGTVSTTHITYNGNLMPMHNVKSSSDFNSPWVVTYTHKARFNYFDLDGVFRYQSGSKGMIRLAGFGHNDPDGIRTVAFEETNYGDIFNIDLSATVNFKIKNNILKLKVDILNLLNRKNDADAYYGVIASRGSSGYSMGRQFFANVKYEF